MKRFGIYKRLSKNVGSVNRILIILTGFKMWRLFCEFIPLFLYSIFINEILVSKRLDRVWEIIVAYAMVYIIVTLGVISEKKYSNMLGIKYDFKVRRALLKKYINGQEFFL